MVQLWDITFVSGTLLWGPLVLYLKGADYSHWNGVGRFLYDPTLSCYIEKDFRRRDFRRRCYTNEKVLLPGLIYFVLCIGLD